MRNIKKLEHNCALIAPKNSAYVRFDFFAPDWELYNEDIEAVPTDEERFPDWQKQCAMYEPFSYLPHFSSKSSEISTLLEICHDHHFEFSTNKMRDLWRVEIIKDTQAWLEAFSDYYKSIIELPAALCQVIYRAVQLEKAGKT